MGKVSRRAVLGGIAGGALAGALPGGSAALAHGDGWIDDDVRWESFLSTVDMLWKRMPAAWDEGPYLGNGLLGSGIYGEPGANAMRFNVQHSQVQDHRPEFGALFGLARLPIGHLTLTPVGAEKAANKEGTIPEWTGGLTTPPAAFQKGSGIRTSPFPDEKPRLVIDGKNAAQSADKLTEGTKELLKRFPTMRVDVYPQAYLGRIQSCSSWVSWGTTAGFSTSAGLAPTFILEGAK